MNHKKNFSLSLTASILLHSSLLLFFIFAPADNIQLGNPTVSIDVLPAAPAQFAKAAVPKEKFHRSLKPVPAAPAESSPVKQAESAATPAPALPALASDGPSGAVMSAYILKIVTLLNRSKIYPQEAIDREQEGKVVLSVTLGPDGKVKEAKITQASFYEVLNKAALKTLQRITQFPPPPREAGDFHFTAPLQYKIERR